MVVALRALDGDSQDSFADGVHAVEHGFHAELLRVHAAFLVDHGIAEKAGGDDLILGGVRQHVASDLFDDELVVGQVAVERLNHPIAIDPHLARLILFKTVGIGVARGIQPDAAPALAVVGRGQQAVDLLLVGVRAAVLEECIDFFDGGRQAYEVEAEAPQERDAVGLG